MSEQKDLVWLPKHLAELVNQSVGIEAYEKEILSFVTDTKVDMKETIEGLDEAILLYRAKMITVRNAFKEAKNAELEANYTLWEGYEKEIKSTRVYVEEATGIIKSLSQEVRDLKSLIHSLDLDHVTKFLEKLKEIKKFTEEEKGIVSILISLKGD